MAKKTTKKTSKKESPVKKEPFVVRVFAHKGKIVMYPSCYYKTKDFVPTGGNNLGCVVINSKKHLQVSEEALALMEKIRKNNDCIGDIGWWKCVGGGGSCAFSWFGAIFRVIDPSNAEADRDFNIWREYCTIIPNNVPKEVKDGMKKPTKFNTWRLPYSLTVNDPEETDTKD